MDDDVKSAGMNDNKGAGAQGTPHLFISFHPVY